jgi:hypothetical protein
MLFQLLTISTLIFPAFSAPPSQAPLLPSFSNHGPHIDNARQNAPQIFNALHSSMRQFGSSLKHNGMSFFPVSIPNNTLLYHGTRNDSPVIGMEWLAFEIEHAEVFARSRMGRPPGRGGDRPPGSRPGMPGEPGRGPPPIEFMEEFSEEPLEEPLNSAYLHIYRTKHPISNLLYVDGMSAGKSSMGTLDTQDLVLR